MRIRLPARLAVVTALLVVGLVRAASAAAPPLSGSVTVVGDGVMTVNTRAYATALTGAGLRVAGLDAAPGRQLRDGWRCRRVVAGAVVDRVVPAPVTGAGTCRPEALQYLRSALSAGRLGDAVIVAVGTHDALTPDGPGPVTGLDALRQLVGSRPLHLVTTATAPGPGRARTEAYNTAAATWCAADRSCSVIDWAASSVAGSAGSYQSDLVQLTAAAAAERARFVGAYAARKPPRTTTTTTTSTTTTTTTSSTTTTTTTSTTTSTSTTSTTAPTSSGVLTAPDGQPGVRRDGVGAFRTACSHSHTSNDDPIVMPSRPGAAHLHQFFANPSTDAFSTTERLRAATSSTCPGGTANLSGYWVPAALDAAGNEVRARQTIVYYKSGYGGVAPADVRPMPAGLRIVAGEPHRTEADTRPSWMRHVFWACVRLPDGAYTANTAEMQQCAAGWDLVMQVQFPQCWNGVDLDSPDHVSHLAYPDNGCPATHPVPIPAITLNTYWPAPTGTTGWKLSSDNYNGTGGRSGHADWWNGWDPAVVSVWMRWCVNAGLDCGAENLGDGRRLI